jgi:hypothetical protein
VVMDSGFEGIVFDITESGWKGAVKEVKPA